MSQVIRQETVVFLLSVLHGAGLTFLYDLIRSLRRAFRHSLPVVSAEDFLFWMTAGFLTFCLAFSETDGIIRGYVAVGIMLGAVLYHAAFSQLVVRTVSGFLKLVKHGVCLLWKILSKPAEKIWMKWKKVVVFTRKKAYNKISRRENAENLSAKGGQRKHRISNKIKGVSQHDKKKKTRKQK